MKIGILALQGAFREHRQMLDKLGAQTGEVRLARNLEGLDGLVLPGGESTTMVRLLNEYDLWQPLRDFHASGRALWGTCAGAILLAGKVEGGSPSLPPQPSLGAIDLTIQRNAFGRQVDSFTTPLDVKGLEEPFPAVFIRAPVITDTAPEVEVLAQLDGQTVHARQGKVMVSSFHPELSSDTRLHSTFLDLAKAY